MVLLLTNHKAANETKNKRVFRGASESMNLLFIVVLIIILIICYVKLINTLHAICFLDIFSYINARS